MFVRILQIVGGLAGVLFIGFTVAFRTKFRPVQDAIRRMNRSVTNPRVLTTAGQPGAAASVVHHVGRRSGASYRTPVVVVPAGEGFAVALPYGPGADWVRNVLGAGSATIEHEGARIPVIDPELVSVDVANRWFPRKEQLLHRFYGVDDFLVVRPADAA